MDPLKRTKYNVQKASKETNFPSTQEASFFLLDPNGSLLIHDENYDLFSDNSFIEIRDSDIPAQKRNLIQDSDYFKQLSLSFYGDIQPLQAKGNAQEGDTSKKIKTEASYVDSRSKSPTLLNHYLPPWRRSPCSFLKSTKPYGHLVKEMRAGRGEYEQSLNHLLTRLNTKDSLVKGPNYQLDSSVQRLPSPGAYPSFGSIPSVGLSLAGSPKNIELLIKGKSKAKAIQPKLKKLPTDSFISKKLGLQTEPNELLSPKTPKIIPNRLKMYAEESVTSNSKPLTVTGLKSRASLLRVQDGYYLVKPSALNHSPQRIIPKKPGMPSKGVVRRQ